LTHRGGGLCSYANIPQEVKAALGYPQADAKDVKSLVYFETGNNYFRQEIKLRQEFGHIIGQK